MNDILSSFVCSGNKYVKKKKYVNLLKPMITNKPLTIGVAAEIVCFEE